LRPSTQIHRQIATDETAAGSLPRTINSEHAYGSDTKALFRPHFPPRKSPRDIIAGGWPAKALTDPPQNIEVGQSWFDQHNVGAFGKVEFHFTQRFAGIGRIHLIGTPITKLRRTFRGIAERSVKNGCEFCRITHDPGLIETGLVERCPDCADPAIHHVAWRYHIGAGHGV